jgi:hypothetical protein
MALVPPTSGYKFQIFRNSSTTSQLKALSLAVTNINSSQNCLGNEIAVYSDEHKKQQYSLSMSERCRISAVEEDSFLCDCFKISYKPS